MKLKHWFQGLIAAVVGAVADRLVHAVADPAVFDTPTATVHFLKGMAICALLTGAAYLLKSPIPFDDAALPVEPTTPWPKPTPAANVQSVGSAVKLLAFGVSIGAIFSLAACSTTTSNPAANARNAGLNAAGKAALKDSSKILGTALVNGLLNVAQQEVGSGGKNVDFGQAAAVGAWSVVNAPTISSAIEDSIDAFSAGKAAKTAQMAGAVATMAIDNGQPPGAVANAIATVISTAAGAPPAK